MMPDVHAGAGCTIGTTMIVKDKICPNLVGVDIGCGMETIKIKENHIEPQKLDIIIRDGIPSGFSIREKANRLASDIDVHSGSRYLGLQIANYYQDAAYKALASYSQEEIGIAIAQLKADGRQKEIQKVLKRLKSKHNLVPKLLSYIEGELFDQYIHDMKIAQEYAELNRRAMMNVIVKGMGFHVVEQFTTIHNYIDVDNMILRKGAVSAQAGERLLIPINMRDGSLICTGKGNEDWNCSAPHGAGRLMSRSAAKETFTVSEFRRQMNGIYTTSVGRSTLDECPMAYKNMKDIVDNIGPTVEIDAIIKPIYNFKAGDEEM